MYERLTFNNFISLSNDNKATYDDIIFIINMLKIYSDNENNFFSFKHCWNDILIGRKWLFIVKDNDIPLAICLTETSEDNKGNSFLDLKLLSGSFDGKLNDYLDYIIDMLYNVARLNNLNYISFEGRLGWKKLLENKGMKAKSMNYICKVE